MTRRRVVWTRRAERDLDAIAQFIASDRPAVARAWVRKLWRAAQRAAKFPRAGRRVPEIGRDDVREAIKAPYRLVYLVTPSTIEVLVVFESHRRFPGEVIDD